jgi:hypothetical protein
MTDLDRLIKVLFSIVKKAETLAPERDWTETKEATNTLSKLLEIAAQSVGDQKVVELYTTMIRNQLMMATNPEEKAGYSEVLDAINKEFRQTLLN